METPLDGESPVRETVDRSLRLGVRAIGGHHAPRSVASPSGALHLPRPSFRYLPPCVCSKLTYASNHPLIPAASRSGCERKSALVIEERGTARLDYDKAALGGAVSGAPVGALLSFAFGLYGPVETFVSDLIMALWGLVFGVLIGAVFGVVSHVLAHGRRIPPVDTLRADRYEVVADAEVAESATRLLSEAR